MDPIAMDSAARTSTSITELNQQLKQNEHEVQGLRENLTQANGRIEQQMAKLKNEKDEAKRLQDRLTKAESQTLKLTMKIKESEGEQMEKLEHKPDPREKKSALYWKLKYDEINLIFNAGAGDEWVLQMAVDLLELPQPTHDRRAVLNLWLLGHGDLLQFDPSRLEECLYYLKALRRLSRNQYGDHPENKEIINTIESQTAEQPLKRKEGRGRTGV